MEVRSARPVGPLAASSVVLQPNSVITATVVSDAAASVAEGEGVEVGVGVPVPEPDEVVVALGGVVPLAVLVRDTLDDAVASAVPEAVPLADTVEDAVLLALPVDEWVGTADLEEECVGLLDAV